MFAALTRIVFATLTPLLLVPATSGILAQSAKKTAHSNKKTPAKPAAHHTRTGSSKAAASGGTARVSERKVIVTRKKVHGRWVRTTQVVSAPRRPSYQQHPDPERLQQIQQALAERGYYKGEVNGQWGDESVAALKQFQADKQLPSDGKVTSLSLIGLGLGPNRTPAPEKSPNSN